LEIACSLNDCFAAPASANTFAVGALVTPHIHTREDEYSIAIGFRSGDREAVQIISPAGFENFFRDLADLVDAGPPAVQDIATLASNYGLQFGDPPWLPDLIKRYNLTPPPGLEA
jgi:hypothetical protein